MKTEKAPKAYDIRGNAKWCPQCGREGLYRRVMVCPDCGSTKLVEYHDREEATN